jgi:hypothetical protein
MIDNLNNILASYYEPVKKSVVGDDIMLICNVTTLPCYEYPIKPGCVMSVHCFSGSVELSVNMTNWKLEKEQSLTVQSDNMVQFHSVSDDFSAIVGFISIKLFDSFELDNKLKTSAYVYSRRVPVRQLKQADTEVMKNFYSMVELVAGMHDNPYQLQIMKMLFLANFYITANLQQIKDYVETQKSNRRTSFEKAVTTMKNAIVRHIICLFYLLITLPAIAQK